MLTGALIAIWLGHPPLPVESQVIAVAFSPSGGWLAAGTPSGRITIWLLDGWRKISGLDQEGGGLNHLAFSPDGRLLAAAGRSLRLWQAATGAEALKLGSDGSVYGVASFSPDGHTLATVNAREQIQLWDVPAGRERLRLCCVALYGEVAFSPDGRLLAASGHWPRLWDVAAGREVRRLVKTRDPTFGPVAFSPDGRLVATGDQDGKARVWNVATGREVRVSRPLRDYVESLAFHPNGRLLAYRGRGGSVTLWDIATGSQQTIRVGVASSNVVFSPDGRWLVFGDPTGVIHVWDTRSGREIPGPPGG